MSKNSNYRKKPTFEPKIRIEHKVLNKSLWIKSFEYMIIYIESSTNVTKCLWNAFHVIKCPSHIFWIIILILFDEPLEFRKMVETLWKNVSLFFGIYQTECISKSTIIYSKSPRSPYFLKFFTQTLLYHIQSCSMLK